jgi:hypothetical protein
MVRVLAILMILSVIADAQSAGDQAVNLLGKQQFEAMAPYIAKGRAAYPSAKRRYLAGLPPGYSFAVRKHLTEPGTHRMEGVYIEVDAIKEVKSMAGLPTIRTCDLFTEASAFLSLRRSWRIG